MNHYVISRVNLNVSISLLALSMFAVSDTFSGPILAPKPIKKSA